MSVNDWVLQLYTNASFCIYIARVVIKLAVAASVHEHCMYFNSSLLKNLTVHRSSPIGTNAFPREVEALQINAHFAAREISSTNKSQAPVV